MEPIAANLESAALQARTDLTQEAVTAARARALGGANSDAAMAEFAKKALFAEALLGASKSHFNEIKTVTK